MLATALATFLGMMAWTVVALGLVLGWLFWPAWWVTVRHWWDTWSPM